jgi:hypothetical protein
LGPTAQPGTAQLSAAQLSATLLSTTLLGTTLLGTTLLGTTPEVVSRRRDTGYLHGMMSPVGRAGSRARRAVSAPVAPLIAHSAATVLAGTLREGYRLERLALAGGRLLRWCRLLR